MFGQPQRTPVGGYGSTGPGADPAPAMRPSLRAEASAFSSISGPRDMFRKYADFFMARNTLSPIIPRLTGVLGQQQTSTSTCGTISMSHSGSRSVSTKTGLAIGLI